MARSPRRSKRRVYWDSCSWTAQIWSEVCTLKDGTIENRGALCRAVIDDATKGTTDIFTSALALVEVNKHPDRDPKSGADKLKDFFENDYIIVVAMDRRVGELGRELMQRRFPSLKPPDATHLASAIIANVDEMHTFDSDLLNLDGKVQRTDGTDLKICKPSMGGPPIPLLESPVEDSVDDKGRDDPESSPEAEEEDGTAIRASGEGTGVPRGRSGIRDGAETDSGGGTSAETPAEEAIEEAELDEDQIAALEEEEATEELRKLDPPHPG
jgi:predicted nucleic acid-binding protein